MFGYWVLVLMSSSYSTDEIVSVSVESGKVQVDLPEAMMRLTAKEQVLINTVSGEYRKKQKIRGVAVWMKRVYVSTVHRFRMWQKNWSVYIIARLLFAPRSGSNNLIISEHDNKVWRPYLNPSNLSVVISNIREEGINVLAL